MSSKLKNSLLIAGGVLMLFGLGEVISRIHFDRSNQNFFFYIGGIACAVGLFILFSYLHVSFNELREYEKVNEEYYIFKIKKENETIGRRLVIGENISAFMDKHNMNFGYFNDIIFQSALCDYMNDYDNTLKILEIDSAIRKYEADKFYRYHEGMALKNGYVFTESESGESVLVLEDKLSEWHEGRKAIEKLKLEIESPFERIKLRYTNMHR